jgi:hypothetical protein
VANETDTLQPPAEKAETRKEADDQPVSAKFWLAELGAAGKRDKPWIDRARKVVDRYRDERGNAEYGPSAKEKRANIFWSNTELLKSALFQGIGNPDVRRRFPKKGKDERTTKQAALVMERSASYSNDAYDCDSQIEAAVEDMVIPGRGVCWVVYDAIVGEDPETKEEAIRRQTVRDEHVYWEDFRTSAGRKWADVWWVARAHAYSRDDLDKYFPDHAYDIPLNATINSDDKNDDDDTFKRARVWEIWDKTKRQRVWIAEGYRNVLKSEEDPYRLEGFFPCPEPLYGVKTTSTLEPVPEFCLYQDQANELDVIATRLTVLIEALKRRGVYDSGLEGSDGQLAQLAFAGDNEFIPFRNFSGLMEKGGLKAAFQTEDLSPIVVAIEGLYKRAESLVQTIYFVTGISDVMRGSNAQEQTATEVRLKGQYGGLRIGARQKKVHRFIRELVRLKTEIIAEHFTREQLVEMTGIEMPLQSDKQQAMMQLEAFQAQEQQRQQMQQMASQAQSAAAGGQGGAPGVPPGGAPPPMMGHNGGPAMGGLPQLPPPPDPELVNELREIAKLPTWEEISAILRSDQRRNYKIDVETDQTNQVDEQVEKEGRIEFLSTMGGLMEKTIPLAMQLPMMRPLVKESVNFAVKAFKAGRPLEEAFDEAFSQLEKMPPSNQPNPEMEKLEVEKQRQAADLQFQQQKAQQDSQIKQQQMQHDAKLKETELAHQMQLEQYKLHSQIELDARKAAADAQMKEREFENQSLMQDKQFEQASRMKERELQHQMEMTESEQDWQMLLADEGQPMQPRRRTGEGIRAPASASRGEPGERKSRFEKIVSELTRAIVPMAIAQEVGKAMQPLHQSVESLASEQEKLKSAKGGAKRIVRDPKTGKAIGVETTSDTRKLVRDPQTGKAIGIETPDGILPILRDEAGRVIGYGDGAQR